MSEIEPETVDRMVALVRDLASRDCAAFSATDLIHYARSVVSDLPAWVDPDLLEARKIADGARTLGSRDGFQRNPDDNHPIVVAAIAGIARGRELALATTPAHNTSQIGEG